MSEDLLPSNATPQERALSNSIARISDVPLPLREVWNQDTCPSELLAWLAWTLAVDAWDSSWTDQQKRNMIKASIGLHRHKGTLSSVKSIFSILGVSAVIREWFELDPPGEPYTFSAVIASTNSAAAAQASIIAAIDRMKPVRSLLTISNVNGFSCDINVAGYACPTIFTRLEFVATYTAPAGLRLVTNTGAALVTNTGAHFSTE